MANMASCFLCPILYLDNFMFYHSAILYCNSYATSTMLQPIRIHCCDLNLIFCVMI